ncbi:MAG: response regulator [Bdellovibrionales bacterium]|nr:response regulator [Bdellovibrionales bacterium]
MGGMDSSLAIDFKRTDNVKDHFSELDHPSVLLVEDDPFSKKLFQYVIRSISKDLEIINTSSFKGVETLFPVLDHIRLAIIDINLQSDKNGFDVLEFLESHYKTFPCILTTGLPDSRLADLQKRSSIIQVPILRKPFLPLECKALIEPMLSRK